VLFRTLRKYSAVLCSINGYKIKKLRDLEADDLLRSTAKLDRINFLLYPSSHTPCAQYRPITIRKHSLKKFSICLNYIRIPIHCNFDQKRCNDSFRMVYSSKTLKIPVLKLSPIGSSHIAFCSFYRMEMNLRDEINKMLLTSKKDVMPRDQSQYMRKHFKFLHKCSILSYLFNY